MRIPVELSPREATIVAVGDRAAGGDRTSLGHRAAAGHWAPAGDRAAAGRRGPVGDRAAVHAIETTADDVVSRDGRLFARASHSGGYVTRLSDGRFVRTTAAVPEPIGLATWDLTVDEWQPARAGQPSSRMNHVVWRFGATDLRPWREHEELRDGIGIGAYTARVTLPASWRHVDGATLDLGRVNGAFRVSVNGRSAGVVDQLGGTVDLQRHLRHGRNEIEVRVATTMINRVRAFQPAFANRPAQDYGLLGPVTLRPYVDMPLRHRRW